MNYFLGVDTSNYTTSLAGVFAADCPPVSVRELLPAPAGSRGLRQSDAHFLHTKHLPRLSEDFRASLPENACLAGVGVSEKPRSVEGSYMPCFLAGVAAANLCAAASGVPIYRFSHQEGHLAAALFGTCDLRPFPVEADEFLALHMSGGTMELLRVTKKRPGFCAQIVAKTLDLTAGQLLDRAGVLCGLSFPAGAALDRLACEKGEAKRQRIPVRGDGINLSGYENKMETMRAQGKGTDEIAHFCLSVAASAVEALCSLAPADLPVLLCGGVASSAFLKRHFCTCTRIYFSDPALSTDNAVGIALLAKEAQTGEAVWNAKS